MPKLVDFETRDGSNESDFTATGVIGNTTYDVGDFTDLRVVVEDVDGTNTVDVKAKILGATAFDVLGTITSVDKLAVSVKDYDVVQFECTTFAATPGPGKLFASAFGIRDK